MIRQAAIELFAAQGYARTTTKEIARAAGVSEGTIFKYFPTKRDLLLAFFTPEIFRPLTAIFDVPEPVDDYRVLRHFVFNLFTLWQRNRHLIRVIVGEAVFDPEMVGHLNRLTAPLLAIVERYFTRRIRGGAFRPLHPAVAARALLSMMMSYFFRWVLLDAEVEPAPAPLADELATLFLQGMVRHAAPETSQ